MGFVLSVRYLNIMVLSTKESIARIPLKMPYRFRYPWNTVLNDSFIEAEEGQVFACTRTHEALAWLSQTSVHQVIKAPTLWVALASVGRRLLTASNRIVSVILGSYPVRKILM